MSPSYPPGVTNASPLNGKGQGAVNNVLGPPGPSGVTKSQQSPQLPVGNSKTGNK